MRRSKILRLRSMIEQAAQCGLNDERALEAPELFPVWAAGESYEMGQRIRFDGRLFRCLQSHMAQADWTPVAAASLWAPVLTAQTGTIPQWVQPDSTNPYQKGDQVCHGGLVWESVLDSNVWEPGVAGWVEKQQ